MSIIEASTSTPVDISTASSTTYIDTASSSSTGSIIETALFSSTATSITDTTVSGSTASSTMVAFPVASPSSLSSGPADATPTVQSSSSPAGLPQGVKDAVYATTIVGGTFLIALLIWMLRRRQVRRRSAARRRVQEELNATTRPRKRPPGFEDPDMSEVDGLTQFGATHQHIPAGLAERFRRKDAYIKETLGEAYPMHTDVRPEERTMLLPGVPPRAMSRIEEIDTISIRSHRSDESIPDDGKVSPLPENMSSYVAEPVRLKRPPNVFLEAPRWSWTNSQAPATPRMYVPTIASSRNSATRFKMAVNWVKTQGEWITSGEAPKPNSKVILPKPGVLKNQASKPNLAPKKLVKKNSIRRASKVSDLERG